MPTITVNDRLSEALLDAAIDDTIALVGRPEPYRQRIVITRGVTIRGVPGPNGEPAVISGEDATTHPGFAVGDTNIEAAGLVTIWHTIASGNVTAKNVILEDLTISGAQPAHNFTNAAGQKLRWSDRPSGLYALNFEGLTLRRVQSTDNGNGIFVIDNHPTRDFLMEDCRIWGNGIIGTDQCHASYVQTVNATYRNNWYGKNRPGSGGGILKDRSANAVIEGNTLASGARIINLAPFDGDPARLDTDKGAIIRGNILLCDGSSISGVFVEGGRSPFVEIAGNTFVVRADAEKLSYFRPWYGDYDDAIVFSIFGNLIDFQRVTPGVYIPECRIVDGNGSYNFGSNWFRPGYSLFSSVNPPRSGIENLIVSDLPPGFKDEANGDYTLVDGAAAAGFGVGSAVTPPDVPPVVPPDPPPVDPPGPPAKKWVEIDRTEKSTSVEKSLAPTLRQTTTTTVTDVFEQEQ